MKKNNVRANSIKKILADQQRLDQVFEASNKEAVDTILNGSVKKGLRELINESEEDKKEDSYEEEEVDTDNVENPTDDDESTESVETETDKTDETNDEESEPVEDDEKVWDNLENVKTEDGEYDLTDKDMDYVMDIFKKMGPDDAIRVVKDDNDNLQITREENQEEFSINLDDLVDASKNDDELSDDEIDNSEDDDKIGDEDSNEYDSDEDETDDTDFGSDENDDEFEVEIDSDLGSDDDDEDDKVKNESTELNNNFDSINDSPIVDEQQGANGMQHVTHLKKGRNEYEDEQMKRAGNAHVLMQQNESSKLRNLKRMANSILDENKQMKSIIGKLRVKVEEQALVNTSLANILKIITENTTTLDEKRTILKRFNEVKTLSQSKQLYETISSELKNSHPMNEAVNKIDSNLNSQSNNKNMIIETKLVESEDINKMTSLLERMDNCYKKK